MSKKTSSGSRRKPGPARSRKRRPVRLRRVLKRVTYLITKKCSDDHYLLVPSARLNMILLYLLILKALRYGMIVHGFCFLTNHFHMVVTDTVAQLPAFMREFLGESSKALQVATKSDRAIWSRKRYSAVALLDLNIAEHKLSYLLVNPSEAELTLPEEWPGLTSAKYAVGEPLTAHRPDEYFSKRRPKTVTLRLEPLTQTQHAGKPPGENVEELARGLLERGKDQETTETQSPEPVDEAAAEAALQAAAESQSRVEALVASGVKNCLEKLKKGKRAFLGPKKAKEVSPDQRGNRQLLLPNPRFASSNQTALKAAKKALKQFEQDHSNAKQRYIEGETYVTFPAGTYGYRVLFNVLVEEQEVAA